MKSCPTVINEAFNKVLKYQFLFPLKRYRGFWDIPSYLQPKLCQDGRDNVYIKFFYYI